MQVLKKLGNACTFLILILLILYIFFINSMPEQTEAFLGYRSFNIVSDSMEPMIPTDSLVFVKNFNPDDELQPGTIITFRAKRFGEEVVVTHYLDHIEEVANGEDRYWTHAYGIQTLDEYDTRKGDILGTYVYHIPYIGKIIMFLKSTNAFFMMGIWFIIFLIYKFFLCILDEQDAEHRDNIVSDVNIQYYTKYFLLTGLSCMEESQDKEIEIVFYNQRKIFATRRLHMTQADSNCVYWRCAMKKDHHITGYSFRIHGDKNNSVIHDLS